MQVTLQAFHSLRRLSSLYVASRFSCGWWVMPITSFSWTCGCRGTRIRALTLFPISLFMFLLSPWRFISKQQSLRVKQVRILLHEKKAAQILNDISQEHTCNTQWGLLSAFSAAFLSCSWSSTALSPPPHSKSIPREVTGCSKQSQLPLLCLRWRFSPSEEGEKHSARLNVGITILNYH